MASSFIQLSSQCMWPTYWLRVDTNRKDSDIKENPLILVERRMYEDWHEAEEIDGSEEES